MADEDERNAEHVAGVSVKELRLKIADLDEREARLTDLYVSQDIDRDAYLERKRALMSERKSAEEQVSRLKHDFTTWLQPLREWINEGVKLNEIA